MSPRWISPRETNELLRAALKERFPGVKFNVRKTTGLSSVVAWTDGPSERAVQLVTSRFEGKDTPDQTDYAAPLTHEVNGERVSYAVNYIFTQRKVSPEAYEKLLKDILEAGQFTRVEDRPSVYYGMPARIGDELERSGQSYSFTSMNLSEMISRLSEARARNAEKEASTNG